MFDPRQLVSDLDPQLWQALQNELQRQEDHVELIASENYVSPGVLRIQGSVLTNKYAEGYPGKRYYGGCEFVDVAEQLAIDRAKALFGAEYANVQPHSGSQANAGVYMAMLEPGDTFVTSGIRIGTPALTTRGFGETEASRIATLMADVLEAPRDEAVSQRVAGEIKQLCARLPVYGPQFAH